MNDEFNFAEAMMLVKNGELVCRKQWPNETAHVVLLDGEVFLCHGAHKNNRYPAREADFYADDWVAYTGAHIEVTPNEEKFEDREVPAAAEPVAVAGDQGPGTDLS